MNGTNKNPPGFPMWQLMQPLASFVAWGLKTYHARATPDGFSGLAAVVALRTFPLKYRTYYNNCKKEFEDMPDKYLPSGQMSFAWPRFEDLPFGKILCDVYLEPSVPVEQIIKSGKAPKIAHLFASLRPGFFAWKIKVIERFEPPRDWDPSEPKATEYRNLPGRDSYSQN